MADVIAIVAGGMPHCWMADVIAITITITIAIIASPALPYTTSSRVWAVCGDMYIGD